MGGRGKELGDLSDTKRCNDITEVIIFINMHVPNTASKYMKQKLTELKGEIDKSTVIAEGFDTSLPDINKQTENQQEYRRTEQYHQPIRSDI